MAIRAIDVSRWQGTIDWHAVKADGVQAAWIKVGGADGGVYRDPKAGANLAGASNAGVPFGTYYFCSPHRGDALDQASHAVTCGHGRGDLWPAADIESNPGRLSQYEMDRWVSDFCAEVQRLTGRESVVYTGSNAGLVGYTDAAPRCPLWVANYGPNAPGITPPNRTPGVPPAWRNRGWGVWQFNSVTGVRGIAGNVDQDVITDAFWAHMTNEAPPTEEDEDMAQIAIVTTQPDSRWWVEEAGGEPGTIGILKCLSTDQFARPMTLDEVRGNLALRDYVVATGGKDYITKPGAVDDWFLYDRTYLPRRLPEGAATVAVSFTPEQVAELGTQLGVSLAEDLAERLAS